MEKLLDVTTVRKRFQITVPKSVRVRFNLKSGDTLALYEVNGRLILKKV